MKCPFSCTWMFLLGKLVYRKHQQKMHLQLASALTCSHLKNLYRPTQEMSLLFLFETLATCCSKTTMANATVTAGLQRLHCWSSGTCFKPWESQRFKWKSSFVSSDRGEMAFPKASPTSQTKTAPRSAVEQTKDLELELLRRGVAVVDWSCVFYGSIRGWWGTESQKARKTDTNLHKPGLWYAMCECGQQEIQSPSIMRRATIWLASCLMAFHTVQRPSSLDLSFLHCISSTENSKSIQKHPHSP